MEPSDKSDDVHFYRRRFPHIHPANAIFFVTSRIADSLPEHAIEALRAEQLDRIRQLKNVEDPKDREELIRRLHKRYFGKFDEYVDRISTGSRWLADPRIAEVVEEALHYRDGKIFDLLCYTIMPNHVHMVLSVQRTGSSLNRILQSLNTWTARQANKILARQGAFWHHESYDHVVRDGADLERIVQYVLLNPVKAGLCKSWQEWKWSYVRRDLEVLD
ncbi:MAG TPA: transposase [Bacteroidota bacterium]